MIRSTDLFRPECPMFSMCLAYVYVFVVPVCFIAFLLYLLPLANKDTYNSIERSRK